MNDFMSTSNDLSKEALLCAAETNFQGGIYSRSLDLKKFSTDFQLFLLALQLVLATTYVVLIYLKSVEMTNFAGFCYRGCESSAKG